jgi:hypothetical protein
MLGKKTQMELIAAAEQLISGAKGTAEIAPASNSDTTKSLTQRTQSADAEGTERPGL